MKCLTCRDRGTIQVAFGKSGDLHMLTRRCPQCSSTREELEMAKSARPVSKHGKLSSAMRKRIGTVGSAKREKMKGGLFLLPKEKKYPVGLSGKYSPRLLLAAARRARMQGRTDLAARADKIRARLGKSYMSEILYPFVTGIEEQVLLMKAMQYDESIASMLSPSSKAIKPRRNYGKATLKEFGQGDRRDEFLNTQHLQSIKPIKPMTKSKLGSSWKWTCSCGENGYGPTDQEAIDNWVIHREEAGIPKGAWGPNMGAHQLRDVSDTRDAASHTVMNPLAGIPIVAMERSQRGGIMEFIRSQRQA